VTLAEQPAEDLDQFSELPILLRSGQRYGAFAKALEAPPVVVDADALGLVDRPYRGVIGRRPVAEQVEHLGPISLVHPCGGFIVPTRIVAELDGAIAEHHRCRVGARQQRAQDCNCGPMPDPLLWSPEPASVFERLAAVVQDIGEEALIGSREFVPSLLGFSFRKWRLRAEPLLDIPAPPLDEGGNERLAIERFGRITIEARIEQAQQRTKALLDAAVRRRGDEDDMPVRVLGEIPQQFVALVFGSRCGTARPRRSVRLVDND